MINYEKQKTEIDTILERNLWFGVEEETKKVAPCPQMSCFECLFHDKRDSCHCGLRSMKWLVSEYEEPKVDWTHKRSGMIAINRHNAVRKYREVLKYARLENERKEEWLNSEVGEQE